MGSKGCHSDFEQHPVLPEIFAFEEMQLRLKGGSGVMGKSESWRKEHKKKEVYVSIRNGKSAYVCEVMERRTERASGCKRGIEGRRRTG